MITTTTRDPAASIWPKLVASFVAGALFSAFSITNLARNSDVTPLSAGAAEESFAPVEETYIDAEGNVLSADDVTVNEKGELVDKQGRLVKKAASAATAGQAGQKGTAGSQGGKSGAGTKVAGGTTGSGSGTGQGGSAECKAGKNGGDLGNGVTANEIKLASTVVKDKEGATLLKASETAMRAVINTVNNSGGICGRRITLRTDNDSWDPQVGRGYIERYIKEGYFALPVVPSSEGLNEAIRSGLIREAGIPVVGTNGLLHLQYEDPWVWPVGSATVSIMRAMAKHARAAGYTKFGIVYDEKYKFGLEGAQAFTQYVEANGGDVVASQPLDPTSGQYGGDANQFNNACGGCEVVVLLLVPDTALQWAQANNTAGAGRGTKKTYAAQTLFTDKFAVDCKGWCHGMVVWTGYNPNIAPTDNATVRAYKDEVRAADPGIDTENQFTEGAYLGMKVFVEAMKQCSPLLTRACVKQKMDALTYPAGISSQLKWGAGTSFVDRAANRSAQAFAINAPQGSFNGWNHVSGFIADPDPK
jgi:ABC-type branched-subunit amino acid transport system substrate-binding protein